MHDSRHGSRRPGGRTAAPRRDEGELRGNFGWWLPVAAPQPRPAVIALHGCDGLYLRTQLNARERSVAEVLGRRGFHVLLSDSCRGADIHSALDWLAARPEVDRSRIVVLGWSHGGNALLAALQHRIGPMPLQARAAVAFSMSAHPRRRASSSRTGRPKSWFACYPKVATESRQCSNSWDANCARFDPGCRPVPTECKAQNRLLRSARSQNNTEQPMPSQELLSTLDLKELLSKLDLIEEHARNTLGDPQQHLMKERQHMIIALVKQIRWLVAEDVLSRTDPEATVRMSS